MKTGKISEAVLKRTVINQITYKNEYVRQGAAVGNDAAVLADTGRDIAAAVATINGDIIMSVKRAFAVAVNSVSAKGAKAAAATVSIMLPEAAGELQLRAAMAELNRLGEAAGVQIAGGHTETAASVTEPVITVNALGYMVSRPFAYETNGRADAVSELDIVMAGEAGLEGTAVLALCREKELRERFTRSYIDKAKTFAEDMLVADAAAVAAHHGVWAMHDASRGGVFGALWELGEYLRCGMNIDLRAVPIRQETVELCEYFDMNPYFICSAGALLIAAEGGVELCRKLREQGKTAEVIGRTSKEKAKAVRYYEDTRYLEPPRPCGA